MTVEIVAGELVRLADRVARLTAPNPGMMTGPGTNSYLLGADELAVLDPGPAIPGHIEALLAAAGGRLRWILVTHTHTDHSPAAAELARRTGAELVGLPPPPGQYQDATFRPQRVLRDGEVLSGPGFELRAVHTPGHASNHLCYFEPGLGWLFTGDHVMAGSTVLIDPPDGNMLAYLRSLDRLRGMEMNAIAPGHGGIIENPREVIDGIIRHRLARESKVLGALRAHPALTSRELVQHVYDDVPPSRHGIAERSLHAHLEKLAEEGRARCRDGRWTPAEPSA